MFIPFISKKLSIYLKPFDNSLVFADGDKDGYGLAAKKEADTEKLMPSLIPEGCSDKYFTIKHPMGYLALKKETESLLLAPKDKSALQAWKFKFTEYGAALVSRDNEALAIAINPKTNSMKLINLNIEDLPIVSLLKYSALSVSPTSGANKYTIKSLYTDKSLTTAVSYSSYWSGIDNGFGDWEFEETDHIVLNGWLRMYFDPTSDKVGRDVEIPVVESFLGTDGFNYKFENRNEWFGWENPYSTFINPYAYDVITPHINTQNQGAYTDENDNYWVAVGPKVPYDGFKYENNDVNINNKFYGTGELDAVIKDSIGNTYYIPCVVGDIKGHTFSNGIVQTWYKYPPTINDSKGTFTADETRKKDYDGLSCIEFIGPLGGLTSNLNKFAIEKIIFYTK